MYDRLGKRVEKDIACCAGLMGILPLVAMCISVLLVASAAGQTNPNWDACRGSDNNARIAACTRIIAQGGKMSPADRAAAYKERGVGHFRRGDYEVAVLDYTDRKSTRLNSQPH